MSHPNTEQMQAAAEASLKELGLAPPGEQPNTARDQWRSTGATAHMMPRTTGGASDQDLLSADEVAETIEAAHQHTKLQAGLRVAGESQAVAEVLAQAGELSRLHAQKLRAAIEPLQRRLNQEAAMVEAMAADEPAEPDAAATFVTQGLRARLVEIREAQASLEELLKLPVAPSTLSDRLSSVEQLLAGT
jgi:hypothetical protein